MSRGPRRLYAPQRAAVRTDPGGAPLAVAGAEVEAIREDWVIEDRWWTDRPLYRHYYELVLAGGQNLTAFRDVQDGSWHLQRT